MSQAPIIVQDSTSAQIRSAQNATNRALATQSAGPTAPPSPIEGQLWRDTSGSNDVLKVYESGSWRQTAWGSVGPRGPAGVGIKGDKGDPGRDAVGALTDAQIGDKAFSNPPSDLTLTEQSAVREAIDASPQEWGRYGLLELTSRTDDDVQETLLLSEIGGDSIATGDKYYVSGGDVGGLNGKTIRRTSKTLGTVSEAVFKRDFATYWEVLFDAPSGESSQAIRDLEQKTQDLSVFAPVATGWTDATQRNQGGFYNSDAVQSLDQAKALNNNQYVLTKTSGIGDHIVARIPVNTDPSQYRIVFTSGRGVHAYHPTLSTYQNLGVDSNWQYFRYQSILGDDVATLTLQVTPSSDHIGHTEFRGTLGDGIVTTDSIKDGAITEEKLDSGISLGGGGGGLSTVATDDTIEGDGSTSDPLKITWRDEVIKNTNDAARMKLVTGDIISGERREQSWGAVNTSGAEGGLAKNNGDGYWNESRAKAATYSARAITASSNGDYFVIRIPVGSDPRQYAIREANTFSGTIDNPVNGMRRLGSDTNWVYYIEDIRMFGTVTLRSSTHLVGQNVWGGKLGSGSVDIDSLANAVGDRLLPAPTGDASDSARVAALNSSGDAWELVPQSGSGGSGLSFVTTDETINGTGTSSDALTIPWKAQVDQNTRDDVRLKLAAADIIVGEKSVASWGKVNNSGNQGGLARNNADGYWNLTRAKAATYTGRAINASSNGDYFVARIPVGSDTRKFAIREEGTFSGTIDNVLNTTRFLGTDDTWNYYVEDVRLFAKVTLRSSTHLVGFNTWGGKLGNGVVDIDALADSIAKRLLPAILGSAGQILQVNSAGDGVEFVAPSGGALAFKQVGRDADHDNDISGRLTDTSIDVPTDSGLYGISFTSGGKIHAFNLAGLNSKSSSNNSFATSGNSYTFDSDSSSDATVYYLGRNTTTGKITVGHRGGNANEVVTLYLIAAS